jgi:hypothetical protein
MAIRPGNAIAIASGCLLLASAALAQPFVPNSIKYKDSGSRPATGRSGSATLEARALIGSDHVTTVEVSSNGTLEKVQLKLTATGVTRNFNGLSSNGFTTTFDDLAHGEPVQVQANVTGVDPSRTDVVTVATSIARRPDLRVLSVSAPPHGVVSGQTRITAVVGEANGETGARANCVLSVDGVDADRADGIWVDAGGTVSCTFAPSFTAAGDKQFAVRVDGVQPGDDDPANNSASGSIKVYAEAEQFAYWTGNAVDANHDYEFRQTGWWRTEDTVQNAWYSSAGYTAAVPGTRVDFPNVRVSFSETTDGVLIHELHDAPLQFFESGGWWDEPVRPCAIAFDNDRMIEMCENPPNWGFQGSFWINASRGAGEVTYRSVGWDRNFATNTPPGYYTWNRFDQYGWGPRMRMGSEVSFRLTVSDGTALWEATGSVPLAPFRYEWRQPLSCYTTYMGPVCSESTSITDGRQGSAWGMAGQ